MTDLLLASAFVLVGLLFVTLPEIQRRWDIARGFVTGRTT